MRRKIRVGFLRTGLSGDMRNWLARNLIRAQVERLRFVAVSGRSVGSEHDVMPKRTGALDEMLKCFVPAFGGSGRR